MRLLLSILHKPCWLLFVADERGYYVWLGHFHVLQELEKMRASCKLAAQVLEYAGTLVKVSLAAPSCAGHADTPLHLISSAFLSCACDWFALQNRAAPDASALRQWPIAPAAATPAFAHGSKLLLSVVLCAAAWCEHRRH